MISLNKTCQIGLLVVLSFLLSHCGGVRTIHRPKKSHLYSQEFLGQIRHIQHLYSLGRLDKAHGKLQAMRGKKLRSTEMASRNNLLGVISFSQERYSHAVKYFQKGLKTAELDFILTAQIKLNLGSAYYKSRKFIRAYRILKTIDEKQLTDLEKTKFFHLFFILAREVGDKDDALRGLVHFLGTYETILEIKKSHYFNTLLHYFNQLGRSEKVRFLEEYVEGQNLAAGYLGFIEVENSLYKGEREFAFKLSNWIRHNFSRSNELEVLISDLGKQVKDLSKIESNSIGIILPFSGKRKVFADRAMLGIDFAIRRLKERYKNIKIYTADSEGNSLMGRRKVQELIEKHSVSFIIGGLFSGEAKEEYLEARKYGVMFFSLTPIFLPRKEKGFLLVEIPGSVESQVKRTLSPEIIGEFGKKIAVIYPDSERGKAYINEVWMQTIGTDIEVVEVQSYTKGIKDFRDPVAKVLGLKYPRFRQEEFDFMKEIFDLKKLNIKRVQVLPPLMNFDWLYLPTYPQDAIQIIPSFAYYDVHKINFIGSPSWRSRILNKAKTGHIYFIGDGIDGIGEDIFNDFVNEYKIRPRLIEMNAFEAVNLGGQFIFEGDESRESYNNRIRNAGGLQGQTGRFRLLDGIWIKEMHPFRISRGKVHRADFKKR